MTDLFCHAAVRLFPPNESGRWRVVNLDSKVTYGCSKLAAMLLLAFMGGAKPSAVVSLFRDRYSIAQELTEDSVSQLEAQGFLVQPDNASHVRSLQLCREWSTYGWVDTADYQLATIDYPFADYATDGREIDFQRMRTYVQDEPDIDRGKRYADAIDRIPVPSTSNALGELTDRFVDVWQGDAPLKNLTKDRCLTLLSSVFGILRRRPLADSPDLIASAVGKTSPSGGSRHPTEAYLFACSVEGLSTGAYHFNAEDASLDLVAELDTGELALARMFSGPMRASFQIDAFVVMTSVFDRSMWRYREPRSFRAVYMDVGHLCGTLDVVARTLGLNCLVQHGLSETPIAKMLRTQPLTEGVIYGAALGGSHRGTQ